MSRVLYLTRVRLRRHRFASLVAALLITIVGGAVLSTLAAGRRTQTAFERLVNETHVTNGSVVLGENPDAEIAKIVKMPEVNGWSHLHLFPTQVAGKPDVFLGLAMGQDDRIRNDVERAHIVRGRAANPDKPFEVVIGEARAKVLGVDLGGYLPLLTFTQKQIVDELSKGKNPGRPGGPAFTLHVVGLERGPRQIINDVEAENDIT